jgi:hypothetical protein
MSRIQPLQALTYRDLQLSLGIFCPTSPSKFHHSPSVQPAIRVPNHQYPWLPLPMRQYQPQSRRIRRYLEHRLTHHRPSPRHPRCQPNPTHSRRLLPPPPLRIHQVGRYQALTLRLPPLIGHPHRHPYQPPPIVNQKSRYLLRSSYRKAHFIKALRLPDPNCPLPLSERNPGQHEEISHPDPRQPDHAATYPLPLPAPKRHSHPQHANTRPPHQPQQQKFRSLHPQPRSR